MEETEKESKLKAATLIRMYSDSFYKVYFTLHPANIEGEIRGKSSNVAWASKEMSKLNNGLSKYEIITVMDADSCFAEDYFNAIAYHYAVATPE